jgi:hypothetical protein
MNPLWWTRTANSGRQSVSFLFFPSAQPWIATGEPCSLLVRIETMESGSLCAPTKSSVAFLESQSCDSRLGELV